MPLCQRRELLQPRSLAWQSLHRSPGIRTRHAQGARRQPAALAARVALPRAAGHAGETPLPWWAGPRTPMTTGQTPDANADTNDLRHDGKGKEDRARRGGRNLQVRGREIYWCIPLQRLDSPEYRGARHDRQLIGDKTRARTRHPRAHTATRGNGHRSPQDPYRQRYHDNQVSCTPSTAYRNYPASLAGDSVTETGGFPMCVTGIGLTQWTSRCSRSHRYPPPCDNAGR